MNFTPTFGKLVYGFEQWIAANLATVQECYTAKAQELFETFEDFAVELYMEIKCG